MAAQQPTPPAEGTPPPPQWQPPTAIQPPPLNPYPPPPVSVYPPLPSGVKVMGDNTKWALGLGIASLFCCGPVTGVIGVFLAKKDMDEAASGRAPQLDGQTAKVAYYMNIAALILFVAGICLFWGRLAALRNL